MSRILEPVGRSVSQGSFDSTADAAAALFHRALPVLQLAAPALPALMQQLCARPTFCPVFICPHIPPRFSVKRDRSHGKRDLIIWQKDFTNALTFCPAFKRLCILEPSLVVLIFRAILGHLTRQVASRLHQHPVVRRPAA